MNTKPARRVVSLSFPTLATAALWRSPGMSAAAISICATSPDDEPVNEALLDAIKTAERLAHWCGRYTPWTSLDDWGGVWLDITGCQHLFGGEDAMIADISARIADQGIDVVAAVADTPGAAWAAARYIRQHPSQGDACGRTVVIEPGAQREILSPLPAAALRIGFGAAEGLRRLGVRRIGDLYPLARAPLAARFGMDVLTRLDQALGHMDEPLSPIRPAPSRRVRMTFPDPIGQTDDLWEAFERLLTALLQRLEAAGTGVVHLELTGYKADGTLTRLSVGIGQASRDADHIRRLVRETFTVIDPGFGIEAMVLAAIHVEPLAPRARTLSGADAQGEELQKLLDRLTNRLGATHVGGLATAESHMPEHAHVHTPFSPSSPGGGDPAPLRSEVPVAPRPLHLFSPPEPIEAVAQVPDGPPAAFKWRRRTHRIVRADGPERMAPEWWLEDPARLASGQTRIRDYYRIEDETGARFWVYRDGLYQSDKGPKWYLHGVFA